MQRLILIVLSAFFFLATPAFAKDSAGNWIVSQRSGDVRVVHRGLQPASVKANTSLAPGDVIMTGPTGRATLSRNSDYIVVAPRSELRLPAEAQPGGFTRVVQRLGTMLFKVKHTGVPHFAVDTPMLAAVVKGTTFTVVVDKDRSAVQVIEGAVQVVATDGGMHRLVEGGNTVFIDRNNPKQLLFATPETVGAVGTTTSAAVKITGSGDEPVSEIVSLTTGLVRAEPVPATVLAQTEVAVLVNASAPLSDSGLVNPDPAAKDPAPAVPGAGDLTPSVPPVTDVPTIVDSLVDPIVEPVLEPVLEAVVEPIVDPIVSPIVETVVEPVVETVVDPIITPIVETVVEPIVETVVDPIITPIVETIVDPIVDPIVEIVVEPIVETIIDPIVTPIVETVVEPIVTPIVETVVEPIVTPIVETVVEPIVTPIVETVVEPIVAPIVETVVEPIVTPIVAPIVEPIVAPIVEPILEILPIVPLLPPLGL